MVSGTGTLAGESLGSVGRVGWGLCGRVTKTQLDWDVGILESRPNPWALYVVFLKLFLRIFSDEMGVLCFVG